MVNTDKVRMAICDGDEENIVSRVEDAEKDAQGGYETLDKELDQLIERIHKLENDKSVGAESHQWRGVMKGAQAKLEKVLQDGGILQGVKNAKVRARIEIGSTSSCRPAAPRTSTRSSTGASTASTSPTGSARSSRSTTRRRAPRAASSSTATSA
ncbi:MAG: hypothetical protein ACREV2_14850 [Burkholderiales bacterium]